MEFLQNLLSFLQFEVQEPSLYGWYHIMCLGITALATVLLCVFHKKDKPERVRLVVLFTTLFVIALEIYKQIVFSFSVTDSGIEFAYRWYAFPFQFCSTPMYIGLLAGLTKKGRLHDACSAYLATYAIFAGTCVMLYPGDVFMEMLGINIQTMVCHGSMIAIGIYLLYTQHVKLRFKTIFKAMAVFASCLGIAMVMNEVAHFVGITEDHTFNMFFVSPYFDSTLPVFSLVQPHVPFVVGLVLYIGVFSLCAFVILSAAIGIKALYSRKAKIAAFFKKVLGGIIAVVSAKKYLGVKIASAIMASFILFMAAVNIVPPPKNVEANPFVVEDDELPMIAAHRGGGDCNPENTMLAFREAVKTFEVEIIESDLYLTKDGYLVYNHNAYIDETCNVNGDMTLEEVKELCENEENRHYIEHMTLAELQQYNFGYYFTDENGEYIYRDVTDPAELAAMGLQIATVDKLFAEFYESHPDLLFIVEIKDGGERGFEACEILYDTLEEYPEYMDRIVVGTFHDEIEEKLREEYPDLLRGAPTGTAAKFILTQYLGVNIFDDGSFACLQIPMSYDIGIDLPLDEITLINRAHRRNIAVQYWTINEEEDMRRLIELGVDCIMTDNPELLAEIIEEYRQKARDAETATEFESEDEEKKDGAGALC